MIEIYFVKVIKLIIFDLWQTLAYKNADCSLTRILKETNIRLSKKRFVKIFEHSLQTKRWRSKFKAYENLCQNMGLEKTKKNILLLMNLRDQAEKKTRIYSHAIPMLKKLKEQGYKIGLISNTSVFSIAPIKKTPLLNYINYRLFSYNIGLIKPDIGLFRHMLKISKTKPKETIMIGNNLYDDVIPLKR